MKQFPLCLSICASVETCTTSNFFEQEKHSGHLLMSTTVFSWQCRLQNSNNSQTQASCAYVSQLLTLKIAVYSLCMCA